MFPVYTVRHFSAQKFPTLNHSFTAGIPSVLQELADFDNQTEEVAMRYTRETLEFLAEGQPERSLANAKLLFWSTAVCHVTAGASAVDKSCFAAGQSHFELATRFMRTLADTGKIFAGINPSSLANLLQIEASIWGQTQFEPEAEPDLATCSLEQLEQYVGHKIRTIQLHVEAGARANGLRGTLKEGGKFYGNWKIWCEEVETGHKNEAELLFKDFCAKHESSCQSRARIATNSELLTSWHKGQAILLSIHDFKYERSGLDCFETVPAFKAAEGQCSALFEGD